MNNKSPIPFEHICTCLELWKGCLLAGIFSMSTSIFDLLWSVAHMIDEENVTFFYLLFVLGIESVLFIFISGVLFVALVKKSRCLLLPWLIMAAIDVVLSLVIAFAELALPNRTNDASCSLPVISTLVSILVCAIMIYCGMVVFAQFVTYSHSKSGIAEIKVTPARHDSIVPSTSGGKPHSNQSNRHPLNGVAGSGISSSTVGSTSGAPHNTRDIGGTGSAAYNTSLSSPTAAHQGSSGVVIDAHNTLKVPQITTPKDAW